jgi:hypothetical protein
MGKLGQRAQGIRHRVAHDVHADGDACRQGKELLTDLAGVGGDAAQRPFLEQRVFVAYATLARWGRHDDSRRTRGEPRASRCRGRLVAFMLPDEFGSGGRLVGRKCAA